MSLSVADAARDAGDVIAIVDGQRSMTWTELSNTVAAQTMPIRTSVELAPPVSTQSVIAIYAALEHGRPLVLRHPKHVGRAPTSTQQSNLASAAVVLETSGSSGRRRRVAHKREALIAHAEMSGRALGVESDDRWLVCLPLAHVSGLAPLVRALINRQGLILEPAFEAAHIMKSAEENRATLISLVPTMLADMVELGWRPPAHVRHVLVGGAPCPPSLFAKADNLGIPMVFTYGMTETFSHIALDGRPLEGVELRVDDDGILEILAPVTTAWPNWLRTSDGAKLDDDGRVTILGRADEMLITGGENVAPARIENVLLAHFGIKAAVVGIPSERWGQTISCAVVSGTGTDLEAVKRQLGEFLAPFERPRRYTVLDSLPTLASGKVDRLAIVKLFESLPKD